MQQRGQGTCRERQRADRQEEQKATKRDPKSVRSGPSQEGLLQPPGWDTEELYVVRDL